MKVERAATISKVLLEEGLGWLLSPSEPADAAGGQAGARLRRAFERLGPTFVKFGQLLSTRVDLFDRPLLDELARLQASVPPFPGARAEVERALGRPVDEVFAEFPDEPVASASIAQVHKARLRDGGGWVAVKVQRPHLEDTLLADLDALVASSGWLDRLVPPYHRSLLHRVVEEYALRARAEIDFAAEARAMERFADVVASVPEFFVPAVFAQWSGQKLLVMDWVEGVRLDGVPTAEALAALGFDPIGFCRSMLRLQLSMAYEHGFVHGDTHPGNLILTDGRIAVIDFGLHAQIPRGLRDKMLEVVSCQVAGQTDQAVDAFVQVLHPERGVDTEALKRDLRAVMSETRGELHDHRLTAQIVHGLQVGARHRLRAQSELFVVVRNLTIVEGIVLRYCPNLDVSAEAKGIVTDIVRRHLTGPRLQDELTELLPQLALTMTQRPRLAERMLALERAFTTTANLGEFLRQQDVLREPPAERGRWAWLAAALAIGVAVGMVLERLLAR
ncbi:MAG: AarF/UbiB family protein [Myxococcota bacterium]